FETKLKVVLAKQQGMSNKEIQQKFQIVNIRQINYWVKYFKNGELHRLQQKDGHRYKYKTNINLNPDIKEIKKIKQQFKANLKINKQTLKDACLAIIHQYRDQFSLNQIIQWLGISKNSYYRWFRQKQQPAFLTNLEIQIQKICFQHRYYNNVGESFFVWGFRRVYQELVNQNIKVNPKTVYLKMKKFNLLCQTRKNRYLKLSSRNQNYIPLSQLNLLKNNFQADRPFQKICADSTYLPYHQNKNLYLSVIMDLYNREIISFYLSDKKDINLVLRPLSKLPTFKQPGLFHSDQGGEFTGKLIQTTLQTKNLIPSFSEKGSPAQNACIEAFFANFKCETVYLEKKQHLTKKRLMKIVNNFIENYNTQRKMKYLNYLSPYQFKNQKENQQTTLR
ncbi:integrase, partial [Spiroplasma sp. ChiS]|uniref:IS3 family transposase n=1 Tax=Spiroplasma sp. ChiS TaxID=2099885 RepID=UPI000CF8C3C0